MLLSTNIIILFLFILLIKISYDDYKTKNIADIYTIAIIIFGAAFNFLNGKSELGFDLFAFGLASIFLFKIIIENILFLFNNEDEVLGEGDILLFGALAMFLDNFYNFLFMVYLSIFIFLIYIMYIKITKKKTELNYPFVPSIFLGFSVIFTYVP